MTRYSQTDAMAAINKYSGDNETALCNIEALALANNTEADAVVGSVARLANTLPHFGPVLALEIVSALARFWAKGAGV